MNVLFNGGIAPSNLRSMDVSFAESQTFPVSFSGDTEFVVDFGGAGAEDYYGTYTVTPKANSEQVLATANKRMLQNVTVEKVPYYETSNEHGTTIYIAEV